MRESWGRKNNKAQIKQMIRVNDPFLPEHQELAPFFVFPCLEVKTATSSEIHVFVFR